ncbi:sugar phosphate isomerase/epimerase family protein [Gulosibacter chungangensis]|uniref:TIM barrel protein n=1 Tax=Gulosibacter chungangensis TaxID=979746 RepID=A0A7J5BHP1_9MICO|nr:sugar phosphate isomerase/epimerase [Gulosibacter chungangensis]KAB1644939.1 TIM barrel protein [Gulosibacter chungangensis]
MFSIAAAPISWGICDVPNWGIQLDADRVLAEMRELGITATETGPLGFLPANPDAARDSLERVGMRAVGSYDGFVLHQDGWRDALLAAAEPVKRLGGSVLVFAVLPAPGDYSGDPGLGAEERDRILDALNEIADLESELGIALAVHPHLGSLIETEAEIDWALRGSRIRFCLDTGHSFAAGIDVPALFDRVGDRIALVHLKDADADIASRFQAGVIDFLAAIREGLFCSLGTGDLDIPAILRTLERAAYEGWVVLEQDAMLQAVPAPGTGPINGVRQSLEYLRGLATEVR